MGADRCPECGADLPVGARFCAYCGVTVAEAVVRAGYRDERRVITALFADLAGSTRLGETLDPEDFRDLTGGALALMGAAIEELGGTVRGTAGDGVLGLFGAPTAHEDDPERAVIAGLRLVERMGAYATDAAARWGVGQLRVRVGVETGLAVLGEVRAGSQVQYDASGDCLNTAARLEGAADLDSVLVGPTTYRLVRESFDWSEPTPLALKGKAEPVPARHALRANGARRSRGQASAPLVGRDRELAAAAALVRDVAGGVPRTVVVTGAAGIGKTRLVRELRVLFEAAGSGAGWPARPSWFEGTCLSYGSGESYLPFRQVLHQVLGPEVESLDQVTEAAAALMGDRWADELAPVLGMILGLDLPDAELARIEALSVESRQRAVVRSFAELLTGLAARGPVAVALDDLHWADAASVRLVEGLVEGLAEGLAEGPHGVPVLLILSMRPETDRAAWSLRERGLELPLSSLGLDAERRLVAELVGEGTLPDELERTLLARSEGNPFYLHEMLRSLQDTGVVVEREGGWAFDHGAEVEVPETVERVVLARIDRLQPADRDLLDAAAVIGREFSLPLLSRIAGAELSPASLANLGRLGLFEPTAGSEYRFSHPLIQETAYTSMLRRGRADLHARAARAIEELSEDGSVGHHAVLARHHSAAGHVAEAVKYHRLAALASHRVVALEEAIDQLDLAIAAAGLLDAGSAQVHLPELHLLRGQLRGRTGAYTGGVEDSRLALEGARDSGDARTEMQALNQLGWLIRVHGYEEAIHHHQQALDIAERIGDAGAQVESLSLMSMIHLNRLRLDVGLELARRALGIARSTGSDQSLGAALDCLKLAALQLGDLELLDEAVAEIVEVQERTGDLFLLQWAYIEGATGPLARGHLAEARRMIDTAVETNQRFASDRMTRALIAEAASWIDRASGDAPAAVAAVRGALDLVGELGTPEWMAWLGATLGSHLIAAGQVRESLAPLESALATAAAVQSPNRTFRAASHLAWAHQLLGDEPAARRALEEARGVLATITAPPGAVFLSGYHSYLAVARVSAALGDPAGARSLLSSVREAAREHGWRDAEREASAILEELG